jgi:hypothetical protein
MSEPEVQRSRRLPGWVPVALPIAAWCAVAALFAVRLAGWAPDDFFITYRYAHNFARGDGFVFNPGERVFGSTDPGMGLLLGALNALTGLPVPLLGSAVFALSLVGIAAVLLIAGRRRGRLIEPVLGGSLLVSCAYFWANQGAAAPLAALLLVSAAVLAARAPAAAGFLAGAAVWARPDAGLGVALLVLILIGMEKRVPWRFVLAAGAVVAAGIAAAWIYYGSPLPNTFGAKTDMAAATPGSWSGARFWPRAVAPIRRHFGAEWPAVLIAGAAGLWPLASRGGRPGRLLALFGLAIAAAYPLLGVPFFSWYILPCLLAVIYGLAFLAGAAGDALAARAPRLRPLLAAGVFALLAFSAFRTGWSYARGFAPAPYLQSYQRGAEWIKASSTPEAAVAYVEIGVLGYYSERPILDLMGLVTPRARPYVLHNNLLGALKEEPTEFVLFHTRGRMAPIVNSRWFRRRYEEVMQFEDRDGKGSLHVYRHVSRRE